jgi:alkane 1-monooxygenase
MRVFRYFSPLLLYLGAWQSFHTTGWQVWLPVLYGFGFIPLLELVLKPDPSNLEAREEELARRNKAYDILLYVIVIFQYLLLYKFLYGISHETLDTVDLAGRIAVMGLLCGVFGINVGHELGHRVSHFEQALAKMLLLTSMYMHFFIEHNKGHHKRVATPGDPSSARYGEMIYLFYFRTIWFSYLSAWHIANREVRKKGHAVYSLHNEMVQFTLIQLAFIALITLGFGWQTTIWFLVSSFIGILLLETVNYIEHYGLRRKSLGDGRYERAMPQHSWNSDHIIGRLMLFELSRHSDHHYLASRKYQVLRHHDDAPQMPTGYPGMMLLSLIPPAWFFVMNKRVREVSSVSVA